MANFIQKKTFILFIHLLFDAPHWIVTTCSIVEEPIKTIVYTALSHQKTYKTYSSLIKLLS